MAILSLCKKAPGRHAAGSFFQREMPACACPACEQDDVAGGGGLGAQHKGAAHGPHHAVYKSILPSTVCLTSAARPSKLPRCSGFTSVVPPGQQAFVLHVPQHLAAAFQRGGGGIALGFELGVLLLQQLVQPFLLFQKRRVQVRQGGAAACFGCRSAGGGLESAPGPNTPFIRLSQSSVYAIKLPSVQCFFFQYSGVWYVLQGKG